MTIAPSCFWLRRQHGLRRGVGTERVILHVDAEFLHATDGRLEPRGQAVNLVKMGGELLRGEADRVVRDRAVVEHVMLQQMMDDGVVGRERLARSPCRAAPAHFPA